MDLVRRQGGGGRRLERGGIERGALRQAPDAGVVSGLGAEPFGFGDLSVQGRIDLAVDHRAHARGPVARDLLGRGAPRNRGHQQVFRRRLAADAHLGEREVEDEIGRDHAGRLVVAHALGVLVEHAGERLDPRKISVRVGRRFDGVLGIEEVRHGLVGAGELADDIGARAIGLAAVVESLDRRAGPARVEHGVEVHLAGRRERVAIDRRHALELILCERLGPGDAFTGFVREAAFEVGVRPFVQPQLGSALRPLAQAFLEEGVEQRVQAGVFVALSDTANRRESGQGGPGGEHPAAIEVGIHVCCHSVFLARSGGWRQEGSP